MKPYTQVVVEVIKIILIIIAIFSGREINIKLASFLQNQDLPPVSSLASPALLPDKGAIPRAVPSPAPSPSPGKATEPTKK